MTVNTPSDGDVAICRNCGGTAPKPGPGMYPTGWYALTVSVPEWYSDDGSGKAYVWLGMFCTVACLLAYGSQLQADADLAHQVYDPVIPTPPARNPQGMRYPRQ